MTPTTERIIRDRNATFSAGYRSGQLGETSSLRDVLTRYPTMRVMDAETYLNGQEDGRAGDTWRLKNLGIEEA